MASDGETPSPSDSADIPRLWNSEFEGIRLGPKCHVQKAEQRFGKNVTKEIQDFVYEELHPSNGMDLDDDDDDDEDEDDDEEDEDMFDPLLLLDQIGAPVIASSQFVGNLGAWDDAFAVDDAGNPIQPTPDHAEMSTDSHGQSQQSFPRVARLRCNLTALSQHYNLYFTAYQDKIYVYQPKAPPEILPPPSIVLHPRRSKAGKVFGGTIDRAFPHQVNQLVVGNLGNLEVILFAMDDGDVGAYYVHTIVRAIIANNEQRQGLSVPVSRLTIPKQFFSENVGSSAWGLAIHEKSRLVAVSSNKHEVTVFAFAMNGRSTQANGSAPGLDSSPRVWSGHSALELEKHFKSRTRTWRIVLPIGQSGHNIPAIAFVDNEAWEAEKVVAVDVQDNTWFLDIWRVGNSPVVCTGSGLRGNPHERYLGWGVLVLPDSSFMHTHTVQETLGLPPRELHPFPAGKRSMSPYAKGNDFWLDTTCSLYYVKDLAPDPELLLRNRYHQLYFKLHLHGYPPELHVESENPAKVEYGNEDDETEMSDDSLDGSESTDIQQQSGQEDEKEALAKRWAALSKFPGPKSSLIDDIDKEYHLTKTIIPSLGQTAPLDGSFGNLLDLVNGAMQRKTQSKPVMFADAKFSSFMTKNLSIMRATTIDIELRHFDTSAASVQCRAVLAHHNHHRLRTQPYDLAPHISERTSMLIHVPELNLVVAGALNGRVALLTLTKIKAKVHGQPLRRGFRVDWVLPRREEEEKRLRPWCALHGIAMSPVPARNTTGLDLLDRRRGQGGVLRGAGGMLPVKYRLILHYMDHTILMYDIEKRGDDVLIF